MVSTKGKVKIVLIGAGSASFGRGTLADVMECEDFNNYDCTMVLVDTNKEALDKMADLAELIKDHYNSTLAL